MPQQRYCWRCHTTVMMLDDSEWAVVAPLMTAAMQAVKDFRNVHGTSLQETLAPNSCLTSAAQDAYFRFTGVREPDPNRLYHHHLSYFGVPCSACGELLRTPKASFCAACGAVAELGI